MTVNIFLGQATSRLQNAGIETARLDCLVLLEDAIGKDRSWLLAHPELELDDTQQRTLQENLTRREQYEPLAYIRGRAEFYGREFYVDSNVLVPRPESESFIELLKTHMLNTNITQILDLGTGSGCIGLTVVSELPRVRVTLADIDDSALVIARKNAIKLGLAADYATTNLLSTITEQYDVVVTNLPYVPDEYPVNRPAAFEPKIALFAGDDGMDLYRAFWQQLSNLEHKPSTVLTESLLEQHELQTELAKSASYGLTDTDGLVQLFRLG